MNFAEPQSKDLASIRQTLLWRDQPSHGKGPSVAAAESGTPGRGYDTGDADKIFFQAVQVLRLRLDYVTESRHPLDLASAQDDGIFKRSLLP